MWNEKLHWLRIHHWVLNHDCWNLAYCNWNLHSENVRDDFHLVAFYMISLSCEPYTWWRHKMETFSALLAFCAGNSLVTGEFSAQRPVTSSFDIFFDLRLNKRLSIQSCGWWFETPPRPLWRHSNVVRCHRRHPWARPLYRDMGCLLWVQTLIYILPKSVMYAISYR